MSFGKYHYWCPSNKCGKTINFSMKGKKAIWTCEKCKRTFTKQEVQACNSGKPKDKYNSNKNGGPIDIGSVRGNILD